MVELNAENRVLSGQDAERALEFFCRHLVVLCITYRLAGNESSSKKPLFFACSGILLCIRGHCSFLTAGHALKELTDLQSRGEIIIESAVLADTFGPDAICDRPIPLDFSNEPKFFIDDEKEGLDFGLIALRPYYVRLLAAHKIKALFEENWATQDRVQFDGHVMLGTPAEFVSCELVGPGGDFQVIGTVAPTMIGVRRLSEAPEGSPATRYPRFVGEVQQGLPLSSLEGMSGGPIMGFRNGPPSSYWIVAIQSSWLKTRRVVFGCPIPVLAGLLTQWIDELAASGDFQSIDEMQEPAAKPNA